MSARTSDNDEHHISPQQTIQPFEWLTSPSSLLTLLQEHVLRQQHTDENITLAQQQRPLQALHVGCGSSTVGEFLVQSVGFSKVINVDCDHDTMQRMEDRWNQRSLSIISSSDATDACLMSSRMEFLTLDFTKEHLPDKYIDSFDLVLDKSTLDCTLCSDTATAALLVECYRTLRSDGGVYMVISFHELDLLLPLLQNLPGAQWTVTHTTMERQVEQFPMTSDPSRRGSTVKAQESFPSSEPSHNNNHNSKKSLNVLIARRSCVLDGYGNNIATSTLDFDAVYSHVHRVNDRWFQEQQPLLTKLRIHELKEAFEKISDIESNNSTDGGGVSLEEAFPILFTEAEREHLTFDHFLEDWEAFVQTHEGLGDGKTLTLETAIAFLTEMQ
ncbi:methyltransferase domain containing protein [Nitzschia inconspicua]|uniref:Methyltransferase domain containing protein n=1 Tax=Nitzschia inconspicua TaxID=303405 RepID=A0A9K3PJI0_9STRA|nr:methyltransferase domain containing protein [Nitzschia inconspicua]